MKSIVKIIWSGKNDTPVLRLTTEIGFEDIPLEKGKELDYEITDERRCTGYHADKGKMAPCPEFREIDSGDQCSKCRRRDVYSGWRTGDSAPEGDAAESKYSVYLAQCGDKLKVGVARSSRLQERWLEQGADYASEIFNNLTAKEALEKEKEISGKGIDERVRKEHKVKQAGSRLLKNKLEELGLKDSKIEAMNNRMSCGTVVRSGRFPRPIKHVKGQLVSNGIICMALTSGKVVKEPMQKELNEY